MPRQDKGGCIPVFAKSKSGRAPLSLSRREEVSDSSRSRRMMYALYLAVSHSTPAQEKTNRS